MEGSKRTIVVGALLTSVCLSHFDEEQEILPELVVWNNLHPSSSFSKVHKECASYQVNYDSQDKSAKDKNAFGDLKEYHRPR